MLLGVDEEDLLLPTETSGQQVAATDDGGSGAEVLIDDVTGGWKQQKHRQMNEWITDEILVISTPPVPTAPSL